jgi:Ser/Thr protein kinase RdoA (MazF antagonist)
MPGSLGEKIGEGAMADIHAWAPGQVLKLFKAGVPPWVGEHEARMTRAAFTAGGPAPEVLDEVTLEGRFGMVLPRLDGPTLLQRLRSREMTIEHAGAILAGLYVSVHKTGPSPDVPSMQDWVDGTARLSGGLLPQHIADGVLMLIERLPPGDGLCHGDLHANNVIMTADGPRIIDWASTVRAPAALDLGRCHITLTELVPEGVDPEPPRALNAAVHSEYARLAGVSRSALTAEIACYLPVLRALALAERATSPQQRERLIQRVEAALRSKSLL